MIKQRIDGASVADERRLSDHFDESLNPTDAVYRIGDNYLIVTGGSDAPVDGEFIGHVNDFYPSTWGDEVEP